MAIFDEHYSFIWRNICNLSAEKSFLRKHFAIQENQPFFVVNIFLLLNILPSLTTVKLRRHQSVTTSELASVPLPWAVASLLPVSSSSSSSYFSSSFSPSSSSSSSYSSFYSSFLSSLFSSSYFSYSWDRYYW